MDAPCFKDCNQERWCLFLGRVKLSVERMLSAYKAGGKVGSKSSVKSEFAVIRLSKAESEQVAVMAVVLVAADAVVFVFAIAFADVADAGALAVIALVETLAGTDVSR